MKQSSVLLGAVILLAGAIVSAQAPAGAPGQGAPGAGRGGPPPAPMTNLQVFPKDAARGQVLQAMQAFTQALGVTCAHCHNFVGPGDPANDMASDAKPAKTVARAMMLMAREINPMVQKAVAPKAVADVVGVNCMMCHRGAAIPQLPPPPARGGGPAGPGGPGAPGAGGPPPAGRGN